MMKTSLFAAMLLIAAAEPAQAGGIAGSVGVGAEYQLSGLGGVSLNYDAGEFHVGGLLGFYDPDGSNNTTFGVGARFYYHIGSTAMSDFGVGGNFGMISNPEGPPPLDPDDRTTDVFLEPGFQIRMFPVANVAMSFTAGMLIGVGEERAIAITGGVGFNAGVGVHYYF